MYNRMMGAILVACSCNLILTAEGSHIINGPDKSIADDRASRIGVHTNGNIDLTSHVDVEHTARENTHSQTRQRRQNNRSEYPGTVKCSEALVIACDEQRYHNRDCCEYANCDAENTAKCTTERCCFGGRGIDIDVNTLNELPVIVVTQLEGLNKTRLESTDTRKCKNTLLFECPEYHNRECCDSDNCDEEGIERCTKDKCCEYPGSIKCKDMTVEITCHDFRDRDCCEEPHCNEEDSFVCSDLVCCNDPRPVRCEKVVECDQYRHNEECCDLGPPCDDSYTLACTTDTCCDERVYEGTIDCEDYPYFHCKSYYPDAKCCQTAQCDEASTGPCNQATCCETEHEITRFDEYHFAPIVTNFYNPDDGSRPGYTRYFCVETDEEHWFLMQTTPNSRLCAANQAHTYCTKFDTKQDCRNLVYHPDNPIMTDNILYDYRVPAAGAMCMHQSNAPYAEKYLQFTYDPESRRSSCLASLGVCMQYLTGDECAADLILVSPTTEKIECTEAQMLMVDHWCYQASVFLSYYL